MEASFSKAYEPTSSADELPSGSTNISDQGIYTSAWPVYNKMADAFDLKNIQHYNGGMDIILLFVSARPLRP